MNARSPVGWPDLSRDVTVGSEASAADYAHAAARFAAQQRSLQASGASPAQARAMGAMADLFQTLAEARQARDEAEQRLAAEPQDALDGVLAGHAACEITIFRSGASEPA